MKIGGSVCLLLVLALLLYSTYSFKSAPCKEIGGIQDFFLENVVIEGGKENIEPFSVTERDIAVGENDPNYNKQIPSLLWKRNGKEIFVSYPVRRAMTISYEYYDRDYYAKGMRSSGKELEAALRDTEIIGKRARAILADVKSGSLVLDKNFNYILEKYGLDHDELNSISWTEVPLSTGGYEYYYRLAFTDLDLEDGLKELYVIDINGHVTSPILRLQATIKCGLREERYDKFYNSIDLKSVSGSDNPEKNYLKILRISPDNSVYSIIGLGGSLLNRHPLSGHYYLKNYFSELISGDFHRLPQCSVLESMKIGMGMFCEEETAKNRIIRPASY